MRIKRINNYYQNFKAHSYKIEPKTSRLSIQTDSKCPTSSEPSIVYKVGNNKPEEDTMEKEDERFTYTIYIDGIKPDEKISYYIKYNNSSLIDKRNGENYTLFPTILAQRAMIKTRQQHRQPLIHAINPGKTVGKIIYKDRFGVLDTVNNINEPTILVTNTFHNVLRNPNIVGLILTNFDYGALSHMSTQFRNYTDVCGSIFDPTCIKKLINLNGENVEIELENNSLKIKKTNKKGKPKRLPPITVPKQLPIDKILSSKEYSPEFVGAKAVNIRKLEELKEQGKINVKIPKSIALPHMWIQYLFDENKGQQEEYERNKAFYTTKECAYAKYEPHFEKRMLELIQEMKKNGLNTDAKYVMVRSAFNGEDLANYSAAGLYDSQMSEINPISLYESIINVAQSKWNEDAIFSRKEQNIEDKEIKPTIIIQDLILPEYKFTLYTNFRNTNKLIIEMYSDEMVEANEVIQPHIFEYDRETKKLTYKSIQLGYPIIEYDENLTEKNKEEIKYNLEERQEIFTLIMKLIENALTIEKEIGHPQDIEGGFIKDEIYLWQTRNIVNFN